VEAAIRDACSLDYFPILVSDATAPAGPPSAQEATINNVKLCLAYEF
jgi:ureidoacrylate peracid hydrolase